MVDEVQLGPLGEVVLYFLVPGIAVAHRMPTERGTHFKGTPRLVCRNEDTGVEEWVAFFEDPHTNVLAITSRVAPEPPSRTRLTGEARVEAAAGALSIRRFT
jgi:hypothetical protein